MGAAGSVQLVYEDAIKWFRQVGISSNVGY
jgi:hypothetical protein